MKARIKHLAARHWLAVFAATALLGGWCQAEDVQFTATVDRNSLSLNESLTLTIQIQGSGLKSPDPRLPSLADFRVLSGPNESSNFQFINGRTSSSKTYTFVLQPQRTGNLTIESAEVTLDGRMYRTDPVAVTVVASGSAPPPAVSPAPAAPVPRAAAAENSGDLFVQVTADKNPLYQHEQVLLTYTIYTKISVSAYEVSKLPSTPGFWVEEFPAPPNGPEINDVVIGGEHYRAAVIRRVALFPTRSGDLRLDPLEVTCQVQAMESRRRSRDPFDMLFDSPFSRYRTEARVAATTPLTLKVLPLPEPGQPNDFNGAVGSFDLDVSLNPMQAKTNEALTMTVRFDGNGNIKMLSAPNFRAPADFESYDPKESVQINKSGNRVTGSKTFEYVLIPRFAGRQKIPPIAFSFFDPSSRSYRTLTQGGFDLDVQPGSATPASNVSGISKEDVKLLGQDVRYLKPIERLKPLAATSALPGSYWLGMALPPVLAALLFALLRLSGSASQQVKRRARRAYLQAQRQMRSLSRIASSGPGAKDRFARFYGAAQRALVAYLGERLELPAQGLKEEEVLERLAVRQVADGHLAEIKDILNTCNFARFAAGSEDAARMEQLLKRLRSVVDAVEAGWERAA